MKRKVDRNCLRIFTLGKRDQRRLKRRYETYIMKKVDRELLLLYISPVFERFISVEIQHKLDVPSYHV